MRVSDATAVKECERTSGVRELNLSVNSAGTNEGRVKRLDFVGGHNNLDITTRVETVKLVEKLEHSTLDLALSSRVGVVPAITHSYQPHSLQAIPAEHDSPLGTDSVDLIDEDDTGRHLLGDPEQLAHKLGSISEVLLDKLGSDNSQERRRCLVRHSLGQQRLSSSGHSVQNNTCTTPRLCQHCQVSDQPGNSHLPFGGRIPISSYSSGCVRGSSTDSLISWICCSSPRVTR